MLRRSPYIRFGTPQLTLRDALAVDRTIVANERTFLGYIRTTLALLAAGGSLLHFVDAVWATITGVALAVASLPMFAFGLHHYLVRRRTLSPLMGVETDESLHRPPAIAAPLDEQDEAEPPGIPDGNQRVGHGRGVLSERGGTPDRVKSTS